MLFRSVLSAQVLQPSGVVVLISSSGRIDDLLAVADIAHARGVKVVAITASHSPLAKKADVALIVDHEEDLSTHVPMVSRILHLLVIDILVVGVAMKRGALATPLDGHQDGHQDGHHPESLEAVAAHMAPTARRAGLGISAAGPLSQLISHSR